VVPPPSSGPDREAWSVELVLTGPTDRGLQEVLAVDDGGPALVIVPAQHFAERLAARLRREGRSVALYPQDWAQAARGASMVVGTRAAAWAPVPGLRTVVVLDAHDEALQSEASPTWSAVDVVVERARRAGARARLVTAVPRATLPGAEVLVDQDQDRQRVRDGWSPLHVVDLRHTDPRTGIYSPTLVDHLRSSRRVVCVLNRKGRALLLACNACDEVVRCASCDGAARLDAEELVCSRCAARRPVLCTSCGGTALKQLRPGVARVREDLESLALRPVGEVTGESTDLPDAEVLVGTEAVLHRVARADVVVFIDFDQELLAPRYRAAEDALVLLARASRIVGGRSRDGIVVTQTRQPEHEVIAAAVHGDPVRFLRAELGHRAAMGWPPATAMARVSGAGAATVIADLPPSVAVLGPLDGRWLLKAGDHDQLAEALVAARRPRQGRTRIEVDPPRA